VDVWHDDEKENRPPGDKVLTQHPKAWKPDT
jgi:hypothetical protein